MGRTTVGAATAAAALLVLAAGPAHAGPAGEHDHPSPTPSAPADPHAGHSGHGATTQMSTTDGGLTDTRIVVLGGFALVNAAVVGSAYVLRRRDRRHDRRDRRRNAAGPAAVRLAGEPR